MPNRKVPTTFRCRWVPRRKVKRVFTVTDAARVYCLAQRRHLERSTTPTPFRPQFEALVQTKCPTEARRRGAVQEVALAATVDNALEFSNNDMLDAWEMFNFVNAGLGVIGALMRFLPLRIGRPIGAVALLGARNQIQGVQQNLVNRIAANDSVRMQVRRDAANDPAFRLRVGQ